MTSVTQDRRFGVNAGMAVKVPCRVATTAAITLSGEQTIDGVAVVTDDRVLVKNQADTTENGIWVADTSTWSRAVDADGIYDLTDGTLVPVAHGTAGGQKVFQLSGTNPITPGSSAISFTVSTTFTGISAFAATLLDDATAADARTTLGAAASGAATSSGLTQATSRVLGRTTAGTGAIEELTLTQVLDLIGSAAQGDILYRGASSWARLPASTSGYFLKTQGAGANPAWAAQTTTVFTVAYDSGNQTITAGGALTLAHSLGVTPKIVQCFIKCTDAGGDIGYAQNDLLCITTAGADGGTGSINAGVSVVPDATNLNIRFGNATPFIYVPNKTTGNQANPDHAKWAFIVRAYA